MQASNPEVHVLTYPQSPEHPDSTFSRKRATVSVTFMPGNRGINIKCLKARLVLPEAEREMHLKRSHKWGQLCLLDNFTKCQVTLRCASLFSQIRVCKNKHSLSYMVSHPRVKPSLPLWIPTAPWMSTSLLDTSASQIFDNDSRLHSLCSCYEPVYRHYRT